MSTAGPEQRPTKIDLDRTQELSITWADGRESRYPLAELRRACPCATCRSEREERSRRPSTELPVLSNAGRLVQMVMAQSAELVGSYALRIHWQDGHSAGIYDFGLLRAMDGSAESTTDG